MKNSILCLLGCRHRQTTIARQIAHPRPFTLIGNHALHNAARGERAAETGPWLVCADVAGQRNQSTHADFISP